MSNDTHTASGVVTYRVLRELGARAQRTFAAVRESHELVVVHRFGRTGGLSQGAMTVSSEQLATLVRDAQSLAKNWHPNIVRVKHVDLAQGNLSIATELLDGSTLADLIALAAGGGTAFPLDVLVRVLLDVLAGVHGIHSLRDGRSVPLGAIHGELCPANIVVGRDGVARVINPFRPRPVRIAAGSEAVGHAAPETLDGGAQDARVDVYAAGVILWEVLTGTKLHDEMEPARVLARQREVDIAPPNSPSDIAYAPLAQIAMRALSFEPSLRFRTAMEMATALRALPANRIATGSVVAARVSELDGERIRGRRAALDRTLSSRSRVATPAKTPANRVPPVRAAAPPKGEDRPTRVPQIADAAPAGPSSSDLIEEAAPSTVGVEPTGARRPPPLRPRVPPAAKTQSSEPATSTAKGLGGPAIPETSSATTTAKGLAAPPLSPSPATSAATTTAKASHVSVGTGQTGLGGPAPPAAVPAPPGSNPAALRPPAPSPPSSNPVAGSEVAPSSSPILAVQPAPLPPAIEDASRFFVEEALAAQHERERLVATTSGLNASLDLDPSNAEEIAVAPPPRRRRAIIAVAAVLFVATVILVIGARTSTTGTAPAPPRVAAKNVAPPTATLEPKTERVLDPANTTGAPPIDESATSAPAASAPSSPAALASSEPTSTEHAPSPPRAALPFQTSAPAPSPVSASPSAGGTPAPRKEPTRRYEPLGI